MIHYLFTIIFFLVMQVATAQLDWVSILAKNEVVLLGEQAHGVASYYAEKRAQIAQMGEVSERELLLLVESPLVLSVVKHLQGGTLDYHYPHTNTEANIEFFQEYDNFGFDLQEDCRYEAFSQFLISQELVSPLDKDLLMMDSLLSLCIFGPNYQKDMLSLSEMNSLQAAVAHLESKVLPQVKDATRASLLRLCFTNRRHLAEYLHLPTEKGYRERIQFRDRIMAENAGQLMAMYPTHFPVIWAANLHIGKAGVMGKKWTKAGVKSMAEYLEENFSLFRVTVTEKMGRGEVFFDEVITTGSRELVDPKYLETGCE
jgi:hypothetical protein